MLNKPSLKLYGSLGCPYVQRVKFFLAENKIPYEFQEIDLENQEQKQSWYKTISPLSKVPCLVLNEKEALVESMVILEYLCEVFANNALPNDTFERANIRRWICFISDTINSDFFAAMGKIRDKKMEEFQTLYLKFQDDLNILVENSKLKDNSRFLFTNEISLIDYSFLSFLNNIDIICRVLLQKNIFESENQDINKNLSFLYKYFIRIKDNTEFLTINAKLKFFPNIEKIPALSRLGMNSLEKYNYEEFAAEIYRKFLNL